MGRWYLACFFFFLWFISPMVHFFGLSSSLAGGLFLSIGGMIGYFLVSKRLPWGDEFKLICLLLGAVIIHTLVSDLLNPVAFSRQFASVFLLLLMLLGALMFSRMLIAQNSRQLSRLLILIFGCLVFLLICSFFRFTQPGGFYKSVFPYNEPSHFVLFFNPLLFYVLVTVDGLKRIALLFIALLFSVLMQNLTLVLSLGLMSICLYRLKSILVICLAVLILYFTVQSTYFQERLQFSGESNNISVLAYLQGWELAWRHLITSEGLGIGFQQLGFVQVHTVIGERIRDLLNAPLNETDGSFDACKLIAEFGIAGIALLLFYFRLAFRALKRLHQGFALRQVTAVQVLACCSILTFFSELFIRGVGYFSPSAFLFVTSIFIFYRAPFILSKQVYENPGA